MNFLLKLPTFESKIIKLPNSKAYFRDFKQIK